MPPTISFGHRACKALRCTNLLATVLKYTVPTCLCFLFCFVCFSPQFLAAWLYPVRSQSACLNRPDLFSFGSAEFHFKFECNPKHRQPRTIPGTFWQVLAQLDSWDLPRSPIDLGRPFDPFYLVGVRG